MNVERYVSDLHQRHSSIFGRRERRTLLAVYATHRTRAREISLLLIKRIIRRDLNKMKLIVLLAAYGSEVVPVFSKS
jgi:hypothetical protein